MASFGYAFEGVAWMFKHERNAPLHVAHIVILLVFVIALQLNTMYEALMLAAALTAFAFECVNTAVEKMCDATSREPNTVIKISKDTASAAVLLSVLSSLAVDATLLFPHLIQFLPAL